MHPRGIGMCRWRLHCRVPLRFRNERRSLVDLGREVPVVRGVICGDLSQEGNGGETGSGAHAFASALWPALATEMEITVQLPSGEQVDVSRLVDLLTHKVVDDRGAAAADFRFESTDTGYLVQWI
jgi:hypothetical protein